MRKLFSILLLLPSLAFGQVVADYVMLEGSNVDSVIIDGTTVWGSTPAAPVVYHYSNYDVADALTGVGEANAVPTTYWSPIGNTTVSVTTGAETRNSTYGTKSIAIANSTSWIEHDVIIPRGIPGRTYKIELDHKRSSLNAPHRAGMYSYGNATQAPSSMVFRNENWQHGEVYLENATNTIDFNLYATYGTNDPAVAGEGIIWDNLTVREVAPNLYTTANCLRPENESSATTGITLSGVTRTARHFDSADATEPAQYLKNAIRSNSRVSEFSGTGYWETTTTGLTAGEAYKFSLAVSGTGTFSGWAGTSVAVDTTFSTPTNEWTIFEIPFVASASSVTHRMNLSAATVYAAGLRVVYDSDFQRTDLYGDYAGSYANHSSSNAFGWSVSGGATAAVETTNTHRGSTALRINGSATGSYIFSYPVLSSIAVGETARVSGRYYVETPGGTQRILIYDAGGTPSFTPLNFDQTNTGRWVRFEIEYTRQVNALGLEIGAGSGVVLIDDLIITNKSESLGAPPPSDPILALSPDAYYTPASIDPAVTVDGNALTTWNDVSGNGFHATPVGSIVLNLGTTGRQAQWAASTYFDIPDNAALDFDPQTDNVTVITRIGDASNPTGSGYLLSKALSTSAQRVYGLYCGTTGTLTGAILGGLGTSPTATLSPNALVITVISGGVMNVWIDGTQVVTNMASGTTAVLTGQSWNIGGRSDGGYLMGSGYTTDLNAIIIGTAATAQQRADIAAYWQVN